MARNKVDLPEPEGPESKVLVPASIVSRLTETITARCACTRAVARPRAPPPGHRTRPREMDNGSSATAIVGPRPLIRLGPGGDPREVPPNGGMEIKWRRQAL